MPVPSYGVLKGRATEGKLAGGGGKKPHYQIHVVAGGVDHRIAVNVVSDQSPSELLFLLRPGFRHPVLDGMPALQEGFTSLPSQPGGLALDFIRGNLFEPHDMKALPFNAPGPDNDLAEIFELYVRRAVERQADVYAFGSRWGPEPGKPDDYFGFEPGNGIHDIHLNQGSPEPHASDNGVWQDGALFIHFPAEEEWLGFFLAFQSQFAQTDDRGNPVPGSPKFGQPVVPGQPGPGGPPDPGQVPGTAGVRIVAALVNPAGDDAGHETVTLLNARPEPVDLARWTLDNGVGASCPVDAADVLRPGDTLRVPVTGQGMALSNRGGTINLLDPDGRKVHGVVYTKDQVEAQGWTIVF